MSSSVNSLSDLSPNMNVIEEDEYIQSLRHIIQRDYFPELSKLVAQNDYIDRLNTLGRVISEEDLDQLFNQNFNNGIQTKSYTKSFEDPETPLRNSKPIEEQNCIKAKKEEKKTSSTFKTMSLTQFLSNYTSEDNASFSSLMKSDAKKHRQKFQQIEESVRMSDAHKALLEKKQSLRENNLLEKEGDKVNQCKGLLNFWSYDSHNTLMFYPKHKSLTPATVSNKRLGPKLTLPANTRFHNKNTASQEEEKAETASTISSDCQSRSLSPSTVRGNKKITTPLVSGYGFVQMTPTIDPSKVSQSPFVTQGNVISTPLHIRAEDDSGSSNTTEAQLNDDVIFKVPEVRKREKLSRKLVKKAADRLTDERNVGKGRPSRHLLARIKAAGKKSGVGGSRTPFATPQNIYDCLSPAARRLMNMTSTPKDLSLDAELRKSYRRKESFGSALTPINTTERHKLALMNSTPRLQLSRTPITPQSKALTPQPQQNSKAIRKKRKANEEYLNLESKIKNKTKNSSLTDNLL